MRRPDFFGSQFESQRRVYYESIKREPKIRGIKKCRCDERLQTKTKEFTRLPKRFLDFLTTYLTSYRYDYISGKHKIVAIKKNLDCLFCVSSEW
jgi:hypothetical protein